MKILSAIDLTRASAYVIEVVERVAAATDAEVYVLHVVVPLPNIASPDLAPHLDNRNLGERYLDEQDQLAELVKQLMDADINATAVFRQGDPVKTIINEARELEVDLIVMGSHGHGPLFDALIGSVSAGVLRQAGMPILVVPIPAT